MGIGHYRCTECMGPTGSLWEQRQVSIEGNVLPRGVFL